MKAVTKILSVSFTVLFLLVVCFAATLSKSISVVNEDAPAESDISDGKVERVTERNVKAGDIITYGSYPQDKDGTIKPIEWIVLDVQDGKALVVSKLGLDRQPYNEKNVSVTWKNCSLRVWLNSEFLNKAFTSKEQELIVESVISTPANVYKKYYPKNQLPYEKVTYKTEETTDKVFLLSRLEASEFFGSDDYFRICHPSDYIKSDTESFYKREHDRFDYSYEYLESTAWWTRTPSKPYEYRTFTALTSSQEGKISDEGGGVAYEYTVRPALYLDVHSMTVKEVIDDTPRTGDKYVEINEDNFPDDTFRNIVMSRYDLDKDGYFSKAEIESVREIKLVRRQIKSIKGIKFFTSLEKLDISKNNLTGTVDLSSMNRLVSFIMNSNLEKDTIALNFDQDMNLNQIQCRECHIGSIDVFACFKLREAQFQRNELRSIDIRTCFDLERLVLSDNEITSIDFSYNKKLKELRCENNRLDDIDLSENDELEILVLGPHLSDYYATVEKKNSIGNLDLSNCRNLKTLWIDRCGIGILDISNCTKLESLDITGNTNVFNRMKWTDLHNLKELRCVKQSITNFDMSRFPSLETLICPYNKISELDIRYSVIKTLDCSYNDMNSIYLNSSIGSLNCNNNKLKSIDISNSKEFYHIDCSHNDLNTINLKAFPELWKSAKIHNKYRKDYHSKVRSIVGRTDDIRRTIVFDKKATFKFK